MGEYKEKIDEALSESSRKRCKKIRKYRRPQSEREETTRKDGRPRERDRKKQKEEKREESQS